MNDDVTRLEAERLRPARRERSRSWTDDLRRLLDLITAEMRRADAGKSPGRQTYPLPERMPASE